MSLGIEGYCHAGEVYCTSSWTSGSSASSKKGSNVSKDAKKKKRIFMKGMMKSYRLLDLA